MGDLEGTFANISMVNSVQDAVYVVALGVSNFIAAINFDVSNF